MRRFVGRSRTLYVYKNLVNPLAPYTVQGPPRFAFPYCYRTLIAAGELLDRNTKISTDPLITVRRVQDLSAAIYSSDMCLLIDTDEP